MLLVSTALLAGCGKPASMSGDYLAKDAANNGAVLLQLVETPDHKLTGQLQLVGQDDAETRYLAYSVSGAVDGNRITLSPTAPGAPTASAAGERTGDKLSLLASTTGGEPRNLVLVPATVADFQAAKAEVEARTQAAAAVRQEAEQRAVEAKRQREFVARTDELVDSMQNIGERVSRGMAKLAPVETRYLQLTARSRNLLRRQSTTRDADARGDIGTAISQAGVDLDQVHIEIDAFKQDFEVTVAPVAKKAHSLEPVCREVPSVVPDAQAACQRFLAALPGFKARMGEMVDALAKLEKLYQEQHAAQQRIERESSRLQ
jgi:hypothetical protein